MMLARIDDDKPDYEQRTFECFRCNRSESVVVKSK
jgi:transcription elongation factor Elf1